MTHRTDIYCIMLLVLNLLWIQKYDSEGNSVFIEKYVVEHDFSNHCNI